MDSATIILLCEMLLSTIVGLFCLYVLANDDVVFIRKNMTLERVFDTALFLAICMLLGARIGYVVLHWKPGYLNPLVFFLFPYFPGLSLAGAVATGVLCMGLFWRSSKLPLGRFFDYFSYAMLTGITVGYLCDFFFFGIWQRGLPFYLSLFSVVVFGALWYFFTKILLPLHRRGELKEGAIGWLFVLSFSTSYLLTHLPQKTDRIVSLLHKEDSILLPLIILSLGFVVYLHSTTLKRR